MATRKVGFFKNPASIKNMKILVIPVLVLAFLIAERSVFANGADAVDGYTSAQCVECHEEMEADHAASAHKTILFCR